MRTAGRPYDALVVGARCAGAATAMLMARRGLRVLAIDRGEYGSDTLSTHALMRGAVLQLHRWGVLPRLMQAGTPAVRSTTFHYGEHAVEVAIKPQHGVAALCAPRRTLLDGALVDAAWEAGAELRHGHTLLELTRRADGRVDGAVVLDPAGQRVAIAADLVVGADGIGSAVARLAGARVERVARHATASLFGYWPGIAAQGYHWHYVAGAGAGAIPTNAGHHCLFVSVPPARLREALHGDRLPLFHRLLRDVAPGLATQAASGAPAAPLAVFAGRRGFFRQAAGPGWALVGDAGYFKDPLTAHGITDALRDAEALAEAATQGSDAAFATYGALRDALSLPLFEVTDAIAAFDWDLDRLPALHRALNAAMKQEVEHLAALPGAATALAGPGAALAGAGQARALAA